MGRASLNSRFFIEYITHRNATAFNMDLRKTMPNVEYDIFEKSTKKKNIDANIKLKTERMTVKVRAFSLNNVFFSIIAAKADRNAAMNEK
jgi:translation elongation factor EF-4